MRNIIIAMLLLVAGASYGQTFTEVRANRVLVSGVLRPGMDTIMLNARDSGTIGHKNGRLYVWNGSAWMPASSFSDYAAYDIPYNSSLKFGKNNLWSFTQWANDSFNAGGAEFYYNDSATGISKMTIGRRSRSDSTGYIENTTAGTIDGFYRTTRFYQTPDKLFFDGIIQYQTQSISSGDIDLTYSPAPYVRLLSISGINRTVKMPPPRNGHRFTIVNVSNHATLRYSFGGGGGTVKDLTGATVTTLDPQTVYEIFGTGAEWYVINKYPSSSGGGSGTVTSVASGYGTSFSAITTTGSVVVDSNVVASNARVKKVADSLGALIGSGGATNLDGLTDVVITSPSNNQVLKFNGTNWVNGTDNTGSGSQTVFDTEMSMLNDLGAALKAQTYPLNTGNNANANNLASQIAQYTAIKIFESTTISGVKWIQKNQGVYTSNNYNGWGLYSYSAGTLTLVASSTDDGNIWKGSSNSVQSKAFSTSYSASPGTYFLCAVYNSSAQTTAPGISSKPGVHTSYEGLFSNSAKLQGNVSNTTSLPSTISASSITASTSILWEALY